MTYTPLETVKNALNTLKSLIVTTQGMPCNFNGRETFSSLGGDGKYVIDNYDPDWQITYAGSQIYALDLEATAAINTARGAIDAASFNGVNLLLKEDDGASLNTSNVATFLIGYGNDAVQFQQGRFSTLAPVPGARSPDHGSGMDVVFAGDIAD